MTITEIMQTMWVIAEAKGLHTNLDALAPREQSLIRLALIHTEISEATQIVKRYGIGERYAAELAEELADAILRIADLAYGLALPLEHAIAAKLETNRQRPMFYGTPREPPPPWPTLSGARPTPEPVGGTEAVAAGERLAQILDDAACLLRQHGHSVSLRQGDTVRPLPQEQANARLAAQSAPYASALVCAMCGEDCGPIVSHGCECAPCMEWLAHQGPVMHREQDATQKPPSVPVAAFSPNGTTPESRQGEIAEYQTTTQAPATPAREG